MIKVIKNLEIEQIRVNTAKQEVEVVNIFSNTLLNTALTAPIATTPISLKVNNQESITLLNNLIFYTHTKQINFQYHYIRNKMDSRKIDL